MDEQYEKNKSIPKPFPSKQIDQNLFLHYNYKPYIPAHLISSNNISDNQPNNYLSSFNYFQIQQLNQTKNENKLNTENIIESPNLAKLPCPNSRFGFNIQPMKSNKYLKAKI